MSGARAAILGFLCVLAPAQSPELRFEAASVKPAAKQEGAGWRSSIDRPPGRFRAVNMSLRRLLVNAFALKDYQLLTPGWMDDVRYDISATAAGAPGKQDVDRMAQNLLVERFRIEMHREQKEVPVYKLTIVRNGHKMKETAIAPDPAPAAPETPRSPEAMRAMMAGQSRDAGGFPILDKPGAASRLSDGVTKMTAAAFSMEQLANLLSTVLGREVVDETGLNGKYDFRLEYGNDGAVRLPVPSPMPVDRTAAESSGPPIFKALQDQLGLKLEPGKAPREVLVIDRAEKTPIEN